MYLKNFFRDKKSIIISALLSFIFLESLAFFAVEYVKKSEIDNYLSVMSPDFKAHVDIANSHLTDISKIFFDTKINHSNIIEIIAGASHTKNLQKQAVLRKKLLAQLSDTYGYMKKYRVRQLHFQLPHSVSFLRFHRPAKFGDSLVGVRETLEYVNENKTAISAFEEGRIFNGFRNVYPLYKGREFVGTVEISFAFDGMQELLSSIDSTSYLFMIKKRVVDKKVFVNEKNNYEVSEFSDFDYDKITLKDTMQMGLNEMHSINVNIALSVKEKLQRGELFSIYFKNKSIYDNHSIVVSFAPVLNLDNELVAYIIHYEFGDFIDIILKNLKVLFIVLTFLVLLLSAIFTAILVNERKKQKAIHTLAVHDALTGIYNRHGVNEILNHKIEMFKRDKDSFSVVFCDIDFFKRINDRYGHDMGDYVLENIAMIVSQEIRACDIFARWGGEEFMLFLPNTDIYEAKNIAEKLRKIIEKHAFSDIDSITCSFGVTILKEGDSKALFLKRVDELLYQAKESGRNCVISDI